MNSMQTKRVPATAITRTRTACFPFYAMPQNGFTRTILAHITNVRYPAAFLCILGGYGFASAGNFIPAAICALLGVAAAAGPDFRAWLHRVRAAEDAALDGIEPDGHYVGDGVPRDQSGQPFEPLSWEGVRRV